MKQHELEDPDVSRQPHAWRTLAETLATWAHHKPHAQAFRFLRDGREEATRTYGELSRRANAIADRLIERGLRGQRALLVFPPGLDFIDAFAGCLHAG